MVDKYTHAFCCYGMPIGVRVYVRQYPQVGKEGGRKKVCKNCLALAVAAFRKQLLESATKALGRPVKSSRPIPAREKRGNRPRRIIARKERRP